MNDPESSIAIVALEREEAYEQVTMLMATVGLLEREKVACQRAHSRLQPKANGFDQLLTMLRRHSPEESAYDILAELSVIAERYRNDYEKVLERQKG